MFSQRQIHVLSVYQFYYKLISVTYKVLRNFTVFQIRPYVNGALYSILAIPSIREEAKAMVNIT